MTKLKNWIWIGLVLVLSIGVSIILFKSPFFDISKFEELAPDFHYACMRLTMLKRPRISTALPWNICCWIPQMQIMWVYGLCTLSD